MTKREQYVRQAARWLVDKINASALTLADCSIDEIESALSAPFFANLALSCQYRAQDLTPNQKRALAKNIAGAVANHPDRMREEAYP